MMDKAWGLLGYSLVAVAWWQWVLSGSLVAGLGSSGLAAVTWQQLCSCLGEVDWDGRLAVV